MRWVAIGAVAALVVAAASSAATAGPRGGRGPVVALGAQHGAVGRWAGLHRHGGTRFAWRGHERFWRARRAGWGAWGAWGPVYGAGPGDYVDLQTGAIDAVAAEPVYRLPTKFDLPQVTGFHPVETAPPQLFVIQDETHGRSGKAAGARVYHARVTQSGEGFSQWQGAPRIIELKAR